MPREASETTRRLHSCELENWWQAVSLVVGEGLPLETTPNLFTFVAFMFSHI